MPSREKGRVVVWKDDQGYGFIAPDRGGGDVFLHIGEFRTRGRRPALGDIVSFEIEPGANGKSPRAVAVHLGDAPWSPAAVASVAASAFFLALALMAGWERAPFWILGVYGVMSLWAFFAYRFDKLRAGGDQRRVPESTLHAIELFGGWPGALVAREWYRHKTRKVSYRIVFWLIVIAHLVFWGWRLIA